MRKFVTYLTFLVLSYDLSASRRLCDNSADFPETGLNYALANMDGSGYYSKTLGVGNDGKVMINNCSKSYFTIETLEGGTVSYLSANKDYKYLHNEK